MKPSVLLLAAMELREIARCEFLLDADSADGLALSQLALYLQRIEQGIPPFAYGAQAFVDALLNSYETYSRRARSPRAAGKEALIFTCGRPGH